VNKILEKVFLSENVVKLEIEAPAIAKARRPGHFIMLRVDENGERIPLTIAGSNEKLGSITLVVQRVGVSSAKLLALEEGDCILDLVGPLGKATHIEKVGTILAVGGGVGIAPLLPIVQGYKAAGNRVISVLAARNKDLLILEDEIRAASDEVIIMTDDGSAGTKGLVTAGMDMVLQREKIDEAIVIGPAVMMKFAALVTQKYGVPTMASLNSIMVDGTGMCGACRVSVHGKTKFVCVDGPEFDAKGVDFDELLMRLGAFKADEKNAFDSFIS